jgi:hypothetical protein
MGKKILFLVGDYAEDYETMVPFQALHHAWITMERPDVVLQAVDDLLSAGTGLLRRATAFHVTFARARSDISTSR